MTVTYFKIIIFYRMQNSTQDVVNCANFCFKVCLKLFLNFHLNILRRCEIKQLKFVSYNFQISDVITSSFSGLILVSEPYFNEAGYERQKGTQQGIENSRMYNEMALLKLVQVNIVILFLIETITPFN
jgi:hypothetical protein